jgi:hypothetical protein
VAGLSASTYLCDRNRVSNTKHSEEEEETCQDQTTVFPYPATHRAPQSSRICRLEGRQSALLGENRGGRVLTWAVESPACGNVKHGPGNGEQNPPAIMAVELCECARDVRLEEQRRSVAAGYP